MAKPRMSVVYTGWNRLTGTLVDFCFITVLNYNFLLKFKVASNVAKCVKVVSGGLPLRTETNGFIAGFTHITYIPYSGQL